MPDITIQEQDVSSYWAGNYNPVTDFAYSGTYGVQTDYGVQIGSYTAMTDGSIWFDHDQDGWFDAGRRFDSDGDVEEFDGVWRKLDGDEPEIVTPHGRSEVATPPLLLIDYLSLNDGWIIS